jgi:phosphatidylserine/phosphatidylglycerophosphate/cardiolipin synthase-like enzyme
MYAGYAELITDKPVQRFLRRLCLSDAKVETLIIVSPIIGTLEGARFSIDYVCKQITRRKIPTYVITRKPEELWHQEAVDLFLQCNLVEVRYNDSLHAKLYACKEAGSGGYALLGSANLTRKALEENIEIGVMIYGRGRGKDLLHELFHWGSVVLRTRSKLVKKIRYERRV